VSSNTYYGKGYQDILTRTPLIKRAKEKLGWEPKISMDQALKLTLDFYLKGRKRADVP
jgi:nucleoside-diphosphate-sugar epimerase